MATGTEYFFKIQFIELTLFFDFSHVMADQREYELFTPSSGEPRVPNAPISAKAVALAACKLLSLQEDRKGYFSSLHAVLWLIAEAWQFASISDRSYLRPERDGRRLSD